ncbi:HAD hydrolase, family IA, variant 3, partial [Oesophagostomum dentatum]
MTGIKAVIFDMGGVLIPAPFDMWNTAKNTPLDLEASLGLEKDSLFSTITKPPVFEHYEAVERGETTAEDFDPLFTEFYNKQHGRTGEILPLVTSIVKALYTIEIIPEMATLVKDLRAAGCKVGLLTNNFFADRARRAPTLPKDIEKYFDVVVESCRAGMRKPEPRVYSHICGQLKVKPEECIFLDDMGINLKPARAMGITTIKVNSPTKAAEEVREILKDLFKF